MSSTVSKLLEIYEQEQRENRSCVLATIIETQGSTYQKPGAFMLFTEDGRYFGLLSGGCIEHDLMEHAKKVFSTGKPTTVLYDMRSADDLIWGLGSGCNGAIKIFMEQVRPNSCHHALWVTQQCYDSQRDAAYAMVIREGDEQPIPGESFFCQMDGEPALFDLSSELQQQIKSEIASVLKTAKPRLFEFAADQAVFVNHITPPPQLLILGAGPDVIPVVEFARQLDWSVSVVDHRPAYADPKRFPETAVYLDSSRQLDKINLNRIDAAIVMSHHFDSDFDYLGQLFASSIQYIGLLGPIQRRDLLLDKLGLERGQVAHRFYSPIGLDIGGSSPEAIALSIVAEVQSFLSGRTGANLKIREGAIHA